MIALLWLWSFTQLVQVVPALRQLDDENEEDSYHCSTASDEDVVWTKRDVLPVPGCGGGGQVIQDYVESLKKTRRAEKKKYEGYSAGQRENKVNKEGSILPMPTLLHLP
eukprot:TRINITY_DN18962_c0_g1_i1.p1 TRINITY_DN18962_c0_g1~~TRINITY_DN18962_c0_g1_i1.p1  ORF type:complete len:109 (+),score=14.08 TRINITY_DN18962_c0_g1_i1:62-388(+)